MFRIHLPFLNIIFFSILKGCSKFNMNVFYNTVVKQKSFCTFLRFSKSLQTLKIMRASRGLIKENVFHS